ncbi:MAG: winged helix-turn-helix domain-containing protein [Chloroflexota bacterium]|nr:winged helix-turn-helix domain-containing protein [Chloroflexota bacterium]
MATPRPVDHVTRSDWLALADGLDLTRLEPAGLGVRLSITREPGVFRATLLSDRPSMAIVCVPPGSAAELDLVASERRRRSRLRVVLLNGQDGVTQRLAALRAGFDAALPIDVDADELRGRLALLAEQTREPRNGHRLRIVDGLELDLDSRELHRDGRPLHLRPKEFGLLDFLARHPGRTFTRRQLLDRVWGSDRDGDDRTVDVHVRWLREKLEEDPEHPRLLMTVRGVGYRLDPSDR